MTNEEHTLIESQFNNLAQILETKLKASEVVICNKVTVLEEKVEETKQVVDGHVDYHNSVNRRIVGFTVKSGLFIFAAVVIVVFILGVKEGIVTTVLAKMIG